MYDPEQHDEILDEEAPSVAADSSCLSSVTRAHSWTEGDNDRCAWCGCRMLDADKSPEEGITDLEEMELDALLHTRPDGHMADEVPYDERFDA